jgi:putative transposase
LVEKSDPIQRKLLALDYDRGIIALDPGVRCFQTGFDGYRFLEFGKGDMGRLARLCQYLDDLMSRISRASRRKRQSMRKAAQRMRNRIRNLIDEANLHPILPLLLNERSHLLD